MTSKLDIIGNHLIASIQMIATRVNPFSTHLIVMACDEMIFSLANARGVLLDTDYRIYIKDEHHKDYRKLIRAPSNYFKHADRDSDVDYTGPSSEELSGANELRTLLNCMEYQTLGGKRLDIHTAYVITMLAKKPHLMKSAFFDQQPDLKRAYDGVKGRPDLLDKALLQTLHSNGWLPAIPPNIASSRAFTIGTV
jgi:hypothetical protein